MHMSKNIKNKTIGVRFDIQTYNKLLTNGEHLSVIVRKAVKQYLRSKENNQKLDGMDLGYNKELVDILKTQIEDLKQDKYHLQQRNDYLSLPLFQRLLLPAVKK